MNRFKEKLYKTFFLGNAFIVVLILAGTFILLIKNSLPAFSKISVGEFLLGPVWNPGGYDESSFGILPIIISTLMVTIGAMLFSVPLGILTAAYIAEVASPREKEIIKPVIEVLAGIPSVVVGFFGIVVLGPWIAQIFNLSNGLNAINGSILLGIMSLPTIISLAEDAITAVPDDYRQASLALGAGKWTTLVRVVIPAALSGITAAVMLGMGRAIGETMTVLMATGNAPAMPKSFLGSVRTMTATVAIELGEVPFNTTHFYVLFAVGLVLFIMTFLVNLASDIILQRYQEVE